jgi:hypothetical protein
VNQAVVALDNDENYAKKSTNLLLLQVSSSVALRTAQRTPSPCSSSAASYSAFVWNLLHRLCPSALLFPVHFAVDGFYVKLGSV